MSGYDYGTLPMGRKVVEIEKIKRVQDAWLDRRRLLLFFNTFICAAGIFLIAAAASYGSFSQEFQTLVSDLLMRITVVGIGTGFLLLGFFGFTVSLTTSRCTILCYTVLMGVVNLLFIGLTITAWTFALGSKAELWTNLLHYAWKASVTTQANGANPLCTLQKLQECSGFSKPSLIDSTADPSNLGCCAPVGCYNDTTPLGPKWQQETCPVCEDMLDNYYKTTCLESLRNFLEVNGTAVCLSMTGVDILLAIILVLTISLCWGTRR